MKNVAVGDTRSFAIVGHSQEGKTSLGEALLHAAGATPELGRVDDGSSQLLTQAEEKERKATFGCAVYAFDWEGRHCTLVDTPGDPNFLADGQVAMAALDGAILVVSAVDGVKVGTETMWRTGARAGAALLAFVNGLDRERADLDATVESLAKMGAKPAVLALPIGSGEELSGVIDLLHMKAFCAGKEGPIPDALSDAASTARERLVEAVAECDDELLEKYLEEGELSEEEVVGGLVAGVHAGKLLPVLAGSATREIGTGLVLRAVAELLPSPADRGEWTGTEVDGDAEVQLAPTPEAPFSALVFKTILDRYAGKLSVFRVVSGTAHTDQPVRNATTETRERLGKIFLLRGTEHVEVPEAGPGDVVAVAKLKHTHTGNVLANEKGGSRLPELAIPHGVLSYAIQARSKGDEDKVFSSLGRLVEEDPTLQVGRDPATGEFLLTGMGELHIRHTVQRLKRMFDVDVDLKTPKVPYRETITARAEHVEGKLKKQTGGKGMFGVCYLTLEPLPRGEGVVFSDEIVGGAIPRNLIPAVEKGVREASAAGPLAGYPVVDVRVRCIDGKHHSVDSNEMAFKLAGSFGFKSGVEKARPTLLEPVMDVEISVPDDNVGDIMGDVSSRRGRVQTSEARGTTQVIKAQVPMAEMLEYASALTSITGGKGAFQMGFSHYDEVPLHVREKVIAEAKAETGSEG
ncbi:MAG: elongation factor G [Myxococcota bacterium]